ncbi:hypothetical protein [Pseudoalteromonas peptidolytica]|uniref:Uncharacterized protein n=1 Tax=Pseudoalteromonas peptidolytica F12-50-A1 TaxID=1315280 RepID=A0A8I0T599_9GAMM|nr:hypothetical protein [Pseudoalteromonas peptidolytica]MBE0348256.1 hypothetical protein [Pseudoalteromonas peptidolytica F12-50-A1]NLR16544.1 hypothetical protein [Pseudoalteromonas peptidolytica]GEK08910.1 hypothetical protein PPE03_11590 [Pseudoalteromonas peptidolytica]
MNKNITRALNAAASIQTAIDSMVKQQVALLSPIEPCAEDIHQASRLSESISYQSELLREAIQEVNELAQKQSDQLMISQGNQ